MSGSCAAGRPAGKGPPLTLMRVNPHPYAPVCDLKCGGIRVRGGCGCGRGKGDCGRQAPHPYCPPASRLPGPAGPLPPLPGRGAGLALGGRPGGGHGDQGITDVSLPPGPQGIPGWLAPVPWPGWLVAPGAGPGGGGLTVRPYTPDPGRAPPGRLPGECQLGSHGPEPAGASPPGGWAGGRGIA